MDALVRAYIGLRISGPLASIVENGQLELRRKMSSEPVRWVDPYCLALILEHLGECSEPRLAQVAHELETQLAGFGAFQLHMAGWTGTPNLVQPKSLSVRFEDPAGRVPDYYSRRVLPAAVPQLSVCALRTDASDKRTLLGQAIRHPKSPPEGVVEITHLEILHSVGDDRMGITYQLFRQIPLQR